MSSPPWDSIPLLALKCILEHLEVNDALAAISTCRHWRSSLLIYEGHRDCLKLHVEEDTKKNEFLTQIFKKHTRRLHIFIDSEATELTLNSFMCYILPQFLDSVNLQEAVFVGPIYMSQNRKTQYAQLRRVILETLAYKHAHVLEKLAVLGCKMNVVDEDDRYVNRQMSYYSKPLSFHALEYLSPTIHENLILSRNNVNMMMFSNLKHIVFEYELISTDSLITLSKLDNLKVLSLNIMSRKGMRLPQIEWDAVTPLFSKGLEVAVNIIALPPHKLQYVIDNAFRGGMPLTSLKVMFCRIFYMKLVHHIAQLYNKTLTEFSWVDRPLHGDKSMRLVRLRCDEEVDAPYRHVNPFIFLAWQCKQLRKLTIHGYWMCEYDLVGITRLRAELELDVSSVQDARDERHERTPHAAGGVLRVLTRDSPPTYKTNSKNYPCRGGGTRPRALTARGWSHLPAGLRARSTPAERAEYIVNEVTQPLGVT